MDGLDFLPLSDVDSKPVVWLLFLVWITSLLEGKLKNFLIFFLFPDGLYHAIFFNLGEKKK